MQTTEVGIQLPSSLVALLALLMALAVSVACYKKQHKKKPGAAAKGKKGATKKAGKKATKKGEAAATTSKKTQGKESKPTMEETAGAAPPTDKSKPTDDKGEMQAADPTTGKGAQKQQTEKGPTLNVA